MRHFLNEDFDTTRTVGGRVYVTIRCPSVRPFASLLSVFTARIRGRLSSAYCLWEVVATGYLDGPCSRAVWTDTPVNTDSVYNCIPTIGVTRVLGARAFSRRIFKHKTTMT